MAAYPVRFAALAALVLVAACDPLPPAPVAGAPERGVALLAASGLPEDSVLAITEVGDRTMIFFSVAAATPEQVAAAPAGICSLAGQSVAYSQVRPPEHPEDLPGINILVITCSA